MGDPVTSTYGLSRASGDKGAPSAPSNDALGELAKKLFMQTNPLRKNLINRSNQFLAGGMDVTQSPIYGALASATDAQYKRARDNVIGNTAPGGALTSALSNVESNRANMLAQGAGTIAGDETNRALTIATGGSAQGLNSLGQAGATQAGLANAQANRDSAMKQGLGQGLGSIIGRGATKSG